MSVATELTRIQNAKSALKTSIENKGVTVSDSTLLSGYSALVDQIQTGGGGGNEDLIDLIERDITTLNIPNSVTTIGQYAFQGCEGLTSITIPNSVTSISNSAFNGCSGLKSITIPDSVTNINTGAFMGCSGLTDVTIGSGVTNIGNSAFNSCSGLTSVTIPNGVTSIGDGAFYFCKGLTSVTIGNGVTSIGMSVFYNCSKLTSVTINATTPPTLANANAFTNTNNCPIYVPSESVSAYKAAINWSRIASRIKPIS